MALVIRFLFVILAFLAYIIFQLLLKKKKWIAIKNDMFVIASFCAVLMGFVYFVLN